MIASNITHLNSKTENLSNLNLFAVFSSRPCREFLLKKVRNSFGQAGSKQGRTSDAMQCSFQRPTPPLLMQVVEKLLGRRLGIN